jgi:hypothetical protein
MSVTANAVSSKINLSADRRYHSVKAEAQWSVFRNIVVALIADS